MCPSWKGTRERRHSPKGRAQLIREWLRQLAAQGFDPVEESRRLRGRAGWRTLPARLRNTLARRRGEPDFSHEVKEALDGCLACKSCTGQCPIKVDVPTFRAKFFELYYGRYLRPSRDYVVGAIEHLVPVMARMPRLTNALAGGGPGRAMLRAVGLVHTPSALGRRHRPGDRRRAGSGSRPRTPCARWTRRSAPAASSSCRTPSRATTRRRSSSISSTLSRRWGSGPGWRPTARTARRCTCTASWVRSSAWPRRMRGCSGSSPRRGSTLVGLDPSMTLTYRAEYRGALAGEAVPTVLLVQEWLARHRDRLPAVGGGAGLPALAALHGAHHGARGRAGLVIGLRGVRPATRHPAVGLLRDGGHLGARGGAPGDVGAHLLLELGGPRRGRRRLGDAARRRLLMPLAGETDRRGEAAAPRAGPPGRDPPACSAADPARGGPSQRGHGRSPPNPRRRRSRTNGVRTR